MLTNFLAFPRGTFAISNWQKAASGIIDATKYAIRVSHETDLSIVDERQRILGNITKRRVEATIY